MPEVFDLYGGRDPRTLPVYGASEAAYCLNIPEKTLLNWTVGQPGRFKPVLTVEPDQRHLSFYNLWEAFVIDELRRRSRFSLQELRRIIEELRNEYPTVKFPLVEVDLLVPKESTRPDDELRSDSGVTFKTHRKKQPRPELFALATSAAGAFATQEMAQEIMRQAAAKDSTLLNVSRGRNLVLPDVLRDFLKRVEKQPKKGLVKLYPFITKDRNPDAPKTIAVDPFVAFGKPVINGTGIPTAAVFQLFRAGDSIKDIAEEYDRETGDIEAAIQYESARARPAAA